MFSILDGVSPIWWLAFALVLGVFEMIVPSTFLLWPALAALAIAAAIAIWPDMSGEFQVVTFALLSLAAIFLGRWAISRWDTGRGTDVKLNDPAARMVGRMAKVVSFEGPEGNVVIDGTRWRARWSPGRQASPGEKVQIRGTEGGILIVSDD